MIKITIFPIVTTRFSSHTKKRTASIRETERNDILTSQFQFMTQLARDKSVPDSSTFLSSFRLLLWFFTMQGILFVAGPKKKGKIMVKKFIQLLLAFIIYLAVSFFPLGNVLFAQTWTWLNYTLWMILLHLIHKNLYTQYCIYTIRRWFSLKYTRTFSELRSIFRVPEE